jgi:hypothetical protein
VIVAETVLKRKNNMYLNDTYGHAHNPIFDAVTDHKNSTAQQQKSSVRHNWRLHRYISKCPFPYNTPTAPNMFQARFKLPA